MRVRKDDEKPETAAEVPYKLPASAQLCLESSLMRYNSLFTGDQDHPLLHLVVECPLCTRSVKS